MNVFARVDHAAGARRNGKTLRSTEVLIWGSPAGGTPLIECVQTVGIDLPQKALVWQDAKSAPKLVRLSRRWLGKQQNKSYDAMKKGPELFARGLFKSSNSSTYLM